MTIKALALLGTAALLTAMTGCLGGEPSDILDDGPATQGEAIKGGVVAKDFKEAALISFNKNGQQFLCSGSVIAPQVVLTAGHCVAGGSNFQVQAPFAGGQASNATSATTFDYKEEGELVDPNTHDVGLVFLANPIKLDQYPTVATRVLAEGSQVVNIGRVQNGKLSQAQLFVSKSIAVSAKDAQRIGFPFDYQAPSIIESGDSGGPVMVAGTHTIVAVNSGSLANNAGEVLARTDLLSDFIQKQIAAHGGNAGGGNGGNGGAQPPPNPGGGGAQPPPNPGGGAGNPSQGSFCFTLSCAQGNSGQQCFASKDAFCSGLTSSPVCDADGDQLASVFCQ